MPYEAIAVQPSTPTMGAEVGNVDLSQPLAEQTQGSGTMPYGKTYPYERAGVRVVLPVKDFCLHTSDK